MRRHPSLQVLSSEHHQALVVAKRAVRMAEEGIRHVAYAAELANLFKRDMEPHFCAEEQWLLPALAAAGEQAAVARTLAEHDHLRRLAERLPAGDQEALRQFGNALAGHVRFEERELFPIAEQSLSPAALAQLAGQLAPDRHTAHRKESEQ